MWFVRCGWQRFSWLTIVHLVILFWVMGWNTFYQIAKYRISQFIQKFDHDLFKSYHPLSFMTVYLDANDHLFPADHPFWWSTRRNLIQRTRPYWKSTVLNWFKNWRLNYCKYIICLIVIHPSLLYFWKPQKNFKTG